MTDGLIYTKGTKFYKFYNEQPFLGEESTDILYTARVLRYFKDEDKYEIYVESETGFYKTEVVTRQYLHSWIRLNPDGVVSFNIVRDGQLRDVMIMVHPLTDDSIDPTPFAVCRQDCVNVFKASVDTPVKGQVWVGISINKNNCPGNTNINDYIQCDELDYTDMIVVYKEDKVEDLLRLVWSKKYDDILTEYAKKRHDSNLTGISTSIKTLMEDQNFMYDFHEAMGVISVPFPVDDGSTEKIKDVIGQLKEAYISKIYIQKYDRTIDTSEFKRDWVYMAPDWSVVTDDNLREIYIVGYDIDPDKDYLTMKFGTNDKEAIMQQLGFKTM